MFTIREGEDELLEALEIGVSGYLLKSAVLSWLPAALMDVYCGTFAMPRRLTGSVVQRSRTTEPRRRAILGANARLTSREWEVLNLIASGLSTRQVADKLTLSSTAIRVHIAAVVRKLGVESRTEAIELFMRAATSSPTPRSASRSSSPSARSNTSRRRAACAARPSTSCRRDRWCCPRPS